MGKHFAPEVAAATKRRDELGKTETRQLGEIATRRQKAEDAKNEKSKIAPDVANGNDKAIAAHAKHSAIESANLQEAAKMETGELAETRIKIADTDKHLASVTLSNELENLLERMGRIPALLQILSDSFSPFTKAFGDFIAESEASFTATQPTLGQLATTRLRDKFRQGMTDALRGQFNKNFAAIGFNLYGVAGADFGETMRPRFEEWRAAIETALYSNSGVAVEGRELFKATTNISGLNGSNLREGTIVSLEFPTKNTGVLGLINRGDLVRVDAEAKGAKA
jgi:hypothetical protein